MQHYTLLGMYVDNTSTQSYFCYFYITNVYKLQNKLKNETPIQWASRSTHAHPSILPNQAQYVSLIPSTTEEMSILF
jgi:hypothetical protein